MIYDMIQGEFTRGVVSISFYILNKININI